MLRALYTRFALGLLLVAVVWCATVGGLSFGASPAAAFAATAVSSSVLGPRLASSPVDPGPAPDDDPYLSFRVRTWELADGLPLPALNVAQTPDGYLWITTFEGLVRFDGVRFDRFTTATTPVFRSHDLLGLYVDREGALWTGGRDGWVYRLRDGTWTAFDLTDILPRHWVKGFAEDASGALWMVSTGPVVARFDGETWSRVPQPIRDVWTPLTADDDGTIWTLLSPDSASGSPEMIHEGGVAARWDGSRFVPAGLSRSEGFVATQHGPLFYRIDDVDRLQRGGRVRVTLSTADGAPRGWFWADGTPAFARLVDRAGRVWVQRNASGNFGTLTVERDGVELARIEPEGGTWIEQVFEDRQGNVWVHTRSSALLQVTPQPFYRVAASDGAPRFALQADEAPDGSILVSTEWDVAGPNLSEIRPGTATPRRIRPVSPSGPLAPHVSDGLLRVGHVMPGTQGERWGLTQHHLVRIVQGQGEAVWTAPGDANLYALTADDRRPERLWIGTDDGRVYAFDTRRRATVDSIRVEGSIRTVHRGPRGRLWIGSADGLWQVDDALAPPHVEPVVSSHAVRGLLNGPDGALWIATEDAGLLRRAGGVTSAFDVRHGLPSNHVTGLLLDENGFFWLSGRLALCRVRRTDVEAVMNGQAATAPTVHLLPSHGHLGASPKLTRAAKARDGALWIPSFKGVTRIDPALFAAQYDEWLPIYVTSVEHRNGSDAPFAADAPLVELPVGERSFTIHYTAPDLRSPSLVRFRTRLDGRDTTWVDQGSTRQVTYSALRPGRYSFAVQAMNAGGIWAPSTAQLTVAVPPRFTETWWFIGLCILGLAGGGFAAYRFRIQRLIGRQRDLNALVDDRTRQLQAEKETVAAQADALRSLDEAKSRVFANISHEFRTPLTLTLGPLNDLRNGTYGPLPAPVLEHLDLARRNAGRVLELVNQLLEVARLESGGVRLRARRVDLATVAEGAVQAFTPLAERKGITLSSRVPSLANDPEGTVIWADPDQLNRILSNLLSNALTFTPRGGAVRVSVGARASSVHLRIRDSGPGIPEADLPYVFDRFVRGTHESDALHAGTGIGLALVRELVELHGATVTVDSQEGFGSLFTVAFRTGRTHLDDADLAPDAETLAEPSFQGDPFVLPYAPDLERAPTANDGAHLDAIGDDLLDAEASDDVTTVLIIEDNAEVRTYLRFLLEDEYRILEAPDGRTGLQRTRETLPDLVLSDVMMPGLDGVDLCRALKADPNTAFIPVVLLTARAESRDRVSGLDEGADAYLTKPFDVDELRARLRNLIASRRQLREYWTEPATMQIPIRNVEADSIDRQFLDEVYAAVETHLDDEDFSVQQLADEVGLSRTHLYRRLRELVDESPSSFVRTVRLQRAAQLLAQDAGTVSEIAYGVGFKSVSHFSRVFREEYGVVPSQYDPDETPAG